MIRYLAAYLGSGLAIAVLDAVWLTQVGPRLYRPRIGAVMMEDGFRLAPAIIFYLLYVAGVVIFAVAPALRDGRWTTAALMGALFGFFCYATYDLTNQATLSVWSTTVTVADITWGVLLTTCGALAGCLAAGLVGRAG